MYVQVCNFVYDCPGDESDEDLCPALFTFNECEDMQACFWIEAVEDDLNWVLATVAEAGDHGPHVNFQNASDGKFLLIQNKNQEMTSGIAEVISPIYQDSGTECAFQFYVYISGGRQVVLYPELRHIQQGTHVGDVRQSLNYSYSHLEAIVNYNVYSFSLILNQRPLREEWLILLS